MNFQRRRGVNWFNYVVCFQILSVARKVLVFYFLKKSKQFREQKFEWKKIKTFSTGHIAPIIHFQWWLLVAIFVQFVHWRLVVFDIPGGFLKSGEKHEYSRINDFFLLLLYFCISVFLLRLNSNNRSGDLQLPLNRVNIPFQTC